MLHRLVRPVARVAKTGTRRYHDDKPYRFATMDDAPKPGGSWQERYDKKQKLYNFQFAGGLLFLAGTIAYGKMSGCFYLNMSPPDPDVE
ncbi:hypothetical protein HCN44_010461 [Aphidius gifuensis]|uniref:Deltamethrin resistance protein prag01 domain-containing protein n=1 Tax=Aphidius gifuensis TaxID=684658 RepID=A0A834XTG7_APHGI|nr:uncharacterized protein LOC122855546 [Aphidius gifuensis]KAF7991660.1 hypothetical protein HCN44_010461 [Aphidius gifuensis]